MHDHFQYDKTHIVFIQKEVKKMVAGFQDAKHGQNQ